MPPPRAYVAFSAAREDTSFVLEVQARDCLGCKTLGGIAANVQVTVMFLELVGGEESTKG